MKKIYGDCAGWPWQAAGVRSFWVYAQYCCRRRIAALGKVSYVLWVRSMT